MGCQNCILRVQRKFLRNFFQRIMLVGTVSEKNSAGFVRTALYFSGELLSKTILKVVDLVFFVVLARFFKHGLPKLYSTCPEAFIAEFFSQNHINWHCERKNSAGFVRTAFYFSEELSSKTVPLYYSLPDTSSMGCQNCILRVQRKFLRNFIHRIILVGTVSEKNSAGFVRTAFYFSGELLSKTILKVVDFVFFVVLARFFKHGLPKLYSTCPEAFFAEFFSQNHNNWHCERKKISWFWQICFLFFGGTFEQKILVF